RSTDETGRKAVEVAARYADGLASKKELTAARDAASAAIDATARETGSPETAIRAALIAHCATLKSFTLAPDPDRFVRRISPCEAEARAAEDSIQADLRRDLFGPLLFRPVPLAPRWRTPTVVQVAQVLYDARNFTDLPILADALEEVGCTSRE